MNFPKWKNEEREEVFDLFEDALLAYNEKHKSNVSISSITKETRYHFIAWLSNDDHLELTFLSRKEEREMFKLYQKELQ